MRYTSFVIEGGDSSYISAPYQYQYDTIFVFDDSKKPSKTRANSVPTCFELWRTFLFYKRYGARSWWKFRQFDSEISVHSLVPESYYHMPTYWHIVSSLKLDGRIPTQCCGTESCLVPTVSGEDNTALSSSKTCEVNPFKGQKGLGSCSLSLPFSLF